MRRILFLFVTVWIIGISCAQGAVRITRMTTNDEVNPVCVNSVRFGWQTSCPIQGTHQTAYEVQVYKG